MAQWRLARRQPDPPPPRQNQFCRTDPNRPRDRGQPLAAKRLNARGRTQ
jgi:hypothetical protein